MPRRPRWYRADAVYCETQRTTDRAFLFLPQPTIRNIIGSAAGRALNKFPVKLFALDFHINHRHCLRAPLSNDPEHLQNLAKFDQMFNSLVARALNKHFGREGALYSSRNRSAEAIDNESLEQQLFYSVLNCVKDGLVDRVSHWQGLSSYKQLATGEVERFSYVDWTAWHREGGKRTKKPFSEFTRYVEVKLFPRPSWEHLPEHKRQAYFRREVRKLEQEYRDKREKEGRRVMGKAKLAKLDPRDRPKSRPTLRRRQPLCHSATVEGAKEYRKMWRQFLDMYYYASGMWLNGVTDVTFPKGTFKPPLVAIAA